ncbi:bacteriophage T4 gp5 trimerisation domain-containing protein, partial [Paraburkholderia xenovorans]|nr:type VI secretion system tip protein VgrG [Paraburkholderia xenovorans]
MLSRSMKGHYGTANAIRFEDKEGAEELWLQAERDMRTEVEHDESHTVRHDRTRTVGHDESTTIDHDRTEKVGRGEQVDIGEDRRHSIGNDAHLSVGRDHKLRIGKDRIEDIGNNRKDTIGADFRINTGGHVAHTVKGHHQIEAGQAIKRHTPIYQLQAGEAAEIIGPAGKITLDSHGITLEAVRILLKGPVHASTGWVENSLDMRSEVRQCTFTPDFFPFSG